MMAPYRNKDTAAVKMDRRLRTLEVKMAGRNERKVLRKMFVLFRDMPHLWNKKHAGYKCQQSVKDLQALLKVYWEFDPFATLATVRRKMDALVGSYVDEWQRVKLARLCHPNELHHHRPWLWHFKDFRFMDSSIGIVCPVHGANDQNDGRVRFHRISLNGPVVSSISDHVSPATSTASSIRQEASPNVFLKPKIDAVYEPHKVDKELESKKDVANFVEAQLQGVDEEQKKIALKLISDALENARLGKLTDETCSQLEDNNYGDEKADKIGEGNEDRFRVIHWVD